MCKRFVYPTQEMMLEEYTIRTIGFVELEGNLYNFFCERSARDLKLHLYRGLTDEQHYILVYMRKDVPFLIKTLYSIQPITKAEVWELVYNYSRKEGRYDYQSAVY